MTSVRLDVVDPPFGPEHGVLFGLQAGRVVDDPVPASRSTVFHTEIEIIDSDDAAPDFRGPHVHGRKGDRFLYLSWGVPDASEPFVMFARAKIKLTDIGAELLDAAGVEGVALRCELQATNERGQPATGSIRPPAIVWSVDE